MKNTFYETCSDCKKEVYIWEIYNLWDKRVCDSCIDKYL